MGLELTYPGFGFTARCESIDFETVAVVVGAHQAPWASSALPCRERFAGQTEVMQQMPPVTLVRLNPNSRQTVS